MPSDTPPILDVRSLRGARETLVYQHGGLFPVLAVTGAGVAVAVLRGGAGHMGLGGRLEVVRSLDGGATWTAPAVVTDSERDDRNPAFGVSRAGTLLLSYQRQGRYDAAGNLGEANAARPPEIMVTRSADGGLTWELPYLLSHDLLRSGSPFGKIVQLEDGALCMAVYGATFPELLGDKIDQAQPGKGSSYLVRSVDNGLTWDDPSLIGVNMNETGLLALPGGEMLALMRHYGEPVDVTREGSANPGALFSARSGDGGHTWSAPVQVTAPYRHPADLLRLSNGDILLTYGNRATPYRIEGLVSRDGGRSWLNLLLAFSGPLYGYDLPAPRPSELGYPSSVVYNGRGITLYYYHPSMRRPLAPHIREHNPLYLAQDYCAIAVTWQEEELIRAIEGAVAG